MRGKNSSPLLTPIQYIKGIGPKRALLFQKLNLYTIADLLNFFPRKYEDRRHFIKIKDLSIENKINTIFAKIVETRFVKRSKIPYFEIIAADSTGITRAIWFQKEYLKNFRIREVKHRQF